MPSAFNSPAPATFAVLNQIFAFMSFLQGSSAKSGFLITLHYLTLGLEKVSDA